MHLFLNCNGYAFARLAMFGILITTATATELQAASFDGATERYRTIMIADMDRALAGAQALRDRVKAKDMTGARKAWIDARIGWERSEVFTSGFIPDLDDAIDAWPDAVRGFHGVEVKLFAQKTADLGDEMDKLVAHLAEADERVRNMPLTPQGLMNGVARLAFEIGDNKVDGGESRLSGTSLDDMRNNADGVELAYRTLFAPPLEASDPKLAERIRDDINTLRALLQVRDLRSVDPEKLRKASEAVVVAFQAAGPKLGLTAPTLEGTAK